MGLDSIRGQVTDFSTRKNEWDEEVDIFSDDKRNVDDVYRDMQDVDVDVQDALNQLQRDFADTEVEFCQRKNELNDEKKQLTDIIQNELNVLDEAKVEFETISENTYGKAIKKATDKANEHIRQLTDMLNELDNDDMRSLGGTMGGSDGMNHVLVDTSIVASEGQDNIPTSMSKYSVQLGNHSIEDDVRSTNPNYDPWDGDSPWSNNCQRCVAAYEARRRGYDVTAQPLTDSYDPLMIMNHPQGWPNVFKGGSLVDCSGNSGTQGKENVEETVSSWGANARGIVRVRWKTGGGHVFIAERVNGVTRFVDPQTGETDASGHFLSAKGQGMFCMRIDHLDFSDTIHRCIQ